MGYEGFGKNKRELTAPGTNIVITTAIPVFDDIAVQRFLLKYAPSALEYICSIGMRRTLHAVPKTFHFSVCAALLKLVEVLDTSKTELNVMLLRKMAPSYYESLEGYFDYLLPLLTANQDPEKSFFLNHNGTAYMIAPLWHLVEAGQLTNIPHILRALYSYEVWLNQTSKFNYCVLVFEIIFEELAKNLVY